MVVIVEELQVKEKANFQAIAGITLKYSINDLSSQ